MKRLLNIVLSATMVLSIWSCKEDSVLTATLDITTSGAALRSLVETNNLDLSDVSSTYSHLFEIQDEDFGDQVAQVNVYVGFTDGAATSDDPANNVAPALFTSLDRSVFTVQNSQTTHDLPEGTFSTTLGDVLTFMSLDVATQVTRGDVVNFNFEIVTNDNPPRIFNSSNVGPNVGATGRFAFFNSPFDYRAAIDDPTRALLSSVSVFDDNATIRAGVADSVFLSFDAELVTLPTVVAADFQGNDIADDVIGTVTQKEDGEYFFFYTAGAAAVDTVTFTVTNAETTAGVPMLSVTESDAYIIDNVAPVADGSGGSISVDTDEVTEITVDIAFDEEVNGEVTYTITSAQFETVTVTSDGDEVEATSISFVPRDSDGDLLSTGSASIVFNVAVTGSAAIADDPDTEADESKPRRGIDLAGNFVTGDIDITLFP